MSFDRVYSNNAINVLKPNMQKIFKNNMKYLKKYHNTLYKQIKQLDKDLQSNKIQSTYELVFVDNYFNLLIKQNNILLFKENAKKDAINRAKQVQFDKTASFDTLNKYAYTKRDLKQISKDELELFPYKDLSKFIKYIDVDKDIHLKNIYKFIFIGSLLGTHILEIDKKINAKYYLIIEPDIEIFYHSLFVTDYNTIANKNGLFLAISQTDENLFHTIRHFLSIEADINFLIKYYLVSNSYQKIFEYIIMAITDMDPLTYSYQSIINHILIQGSQNIKKNYKFLIKKDTLSKNFFKHRPVLVVAPGPSLGDNINWLKKHKDKFIIIAFLASLPKLYQNNIQPDIVTNIDAKEIMNQHLKNIPSKFLRNTFFITSKDTHHSVLKKFNFKNIYMVELLSNKKHKGIKNINGWSIGEISYYILLELNVKFLYLLGTDLAIKEDGTTHDKSHVDVKSKNLSAKDNYERLYKKGIIDHKEQIIEVNGNFKDKVFTNLYFNRNLKKYNEISNIYLKKWQKVYNMSDGAYINKTIALHTKELNMDNFKPLDKKPLKKFLQSISQKGFTKKEKKQAKSDIKYILKIKHKYSYLNQFTPKSYKKYKKAFYKYYFQLAKVDKLLSDTLKSYFMIIHNLLEYKFNDKNLSKNKKQKLLKKFFKIELKQIDYILQSYLNYLKTIKGTK